MSRPTLFLVAVSYGVPPDKLDFTGRLQQAEQLVLLQFPGHAANDARTVIAELLMSACKMSDCWPRHPRTGQPLTKERRMRAFCAALELTDLLHPEMTKRILRAKRIGDRGSHGKPVSSTAAWEAIETAYRLCRAVEILRAQLYRPNTARGESTSKE